MSTPADARPPLDAATVAAPDGWRVEVVAEVGSTNAELSDRFRAGEREGLVLVAEHQTSGRGRLGRDWVVAPGSSLTVSVLLEPDAAPERWAWLPLLTGLAAVRAVTRCAGDAAAVALKWPNDVLLGAPGDDPLDGSWLKVGGILLERVEQDGRVAAVLGVGLNVHQRRDELPVDTATSLALAGAGVGRADLLTALLAELSTSYAVWAGGPGGDARLRDDYLALCSTPGRDVRVSVPGGTLEGRAVDVDPDGRLVVRTVAGEERLGAGDVVHVRPAG